MAVTFFYFKKEIFKKVFISISVSHNGEVPPYIFRSLIQRRRLSNKTYVSVQP